MQKSFPHLLFKSIHQFIPNTFFAELQRQWCCMNFRSVGKNHSCQQQQQQKSWRSTQRRWLTSHLPHSCNSRHNLTYLCLFHYISSPLLVTTLSNYESHCRFISSSSLRVQAAYLLLCAITRSWTHGFLNYGSSTSILLLFVAIKIRAYVQKSFRINHSLFSVYKAPAESQKYWHQDSIQLFSLSLVHRNKACIERGSWLCCDL